MLTINELEEKFADYEQRINRLKEIESNVFMYFGGALNIKERFEPLKDSDEIEELKSLIKNPLQVDRAEELYSILPKKVKWEKAGNIDKARELLKKKKYDEAIDLARKELKTERKIQAALVIAEAEKKKKMPELAIEILLKALKDAEINEDTQEAFYTLALLYEETGEEEKAKGVYKKFLSAFIKYKDVEERYNKLKKTTPKRKITPVSARPVSTGTVTGKDIGLSKEAQERYVLTREIGKGGMGVVYEAKDTILDRKVALKVMRAEISIRKRERDRFLKEARTSARLNHPNIVTLYDIVEDESGQIFLVFEYVDGSNLSHIIDKKGKLPIDESINSGIQVLEGLRYAHTEGIIHRDLKPSNIMITKKGKPKILDFGIARVAYDTIYTFTGQTSGTPAYMAPEQHLGDKLKFDSCRLFLNIKP